ncbi:glycosyltransferase [Collinsella tanakaei]|uniref:glycosyltransferase n=1 Tax=Collinsella tanakaei TaxID=626935 RepID=UPI0025A3A20A|nr:glycosyltransferase [Collinsella tanakaei]MDM8246381.1 glycosyltransferase [Collinsella tanakaei]
MRGKGIIDYLEAAKAVKAVHPEVSFRVAGPFDTNPTALHPDELEPYIDEGTIEYLGELLPNEVQSAVEQCSAFVLPSYYGEGTPKSALEAMATGRALIVADAVGCREVVRPGENGFLVQPKNPHEIAAAMERLLFEKGLLERMGAASRRIAERVFDVNKVNAVICKSMGIEPACSADFNKPLD